MRKFILKCCSIGGIFILIIILINYTYDPANLYNNSLIDEMAIKLSQGNIIVTPGNFDERLYQEKRIELMVEAPETLIIGSSHVMYADWQENDYYIGGVSGAVIEDLLGILGIFETNNIHLNKVILGIDPWIFSSATEEARYKSIQKYVDYKIQALDKIEQNANLEKKDDLSSLYEKGKELFSLAYFQSSVKAMVKAIFNNESEELVIKDNDCVEDNMKMLPNGRRVPAQKQFYSVKENESSARNAVSNKRIYHVEGFKTLDANDVKYFEKMIDDLLENNIEVELYLPAWHPTYYEAFENNSEYKGVLEAEKYVRNFAKSRNITVHGSYNPHVSGINEADFLDSLHLKPEKVIQDFNTIIE